MVRKRTKWLLSLPLGWAISIGGVSLADDTIDVSEPAPLTEALPPAIDEVVEQTPITFKPQAMAPAVPVEPAAVEPAAVESAATAEAPVPVVDEPVTENLADAEPAPVSPELLETEVISERYPNRNVRLERTVVQDASRNYINHGAWTMWDPQGRLLGTGHYEMGKRHGKWVRYYLEPKSHELFFGPIDQNFQLPFVSNVEFDQDVLHGVWSLADAKGHKIAVWELSHGRLDGAATWYHPNGKERLVLTYKNETLDGEALEYDASGNLVRRDEYLEGRKVVPYAKKYKNGSKQVEGFYIQAKENYVTTIDWWNGQVKIESVGQKGPELKHGRWIAYYEDGGRQFDREFKEDVPVGRHFAWYPNGQKAMEGTFDNGKRCGAWIWWHANGQKHVEGAYTDGTESGTWVKWNEDGKVAEVQEHTLKSQNVATRPALTSPLPAIDRIPTEEANPSEFPLDKASLRQ